MMNQSYILWENDLNGKYIKTLVNEMRLAGDHCIEFNADDLSSGIYIYRMIAGNKVLSQKMILMK